MRKGSCVDIVPFAFIFIIILVAGNGGGREVAREDGKEGDGTDDEVGDLDQILPSDLDWSDEDDGDWDSKLLIFLHAGGGERGRGGVIDIGGI